MVGALMTPNLVWIKKFLALPVIRNIDLFFGSCCKTVRAYCVMSGVCIVLLSALALFSPFSQKNVSFLFLLIIAEMIFVRMNPESLINRFVASYNAVLIWLMGAIAFFVLGGSITIPIAFFIFLSYQEIRKARAILALFTQKYPNGLNTPMRDCLDFS